MGPIKSLRRWSSCTFIRKFYTVIEAMAGAPNNFFLLNYCLKEQTPWAVLPYKSDMGARQKKGSRTLLYGRVPNPLPPLAGTYSMTTNYITGTENFNSNKDNFRALSSQGLFESIVINLYPNKAFQQSV